MAGKFSSSWSAASWTEEEELWLDWCRRWKKLMSWSDSGLRIVELIFQFENLFIDQLERFTSIR